MRTYIFEIYYDSLDGKERLKMTYTYKASTDLDAFTYLCETNDYQSLSYSQNIVLNMRTE